MNRVLLFLSLALITLSGCKESMPELSDRVFQLAQDQAILMSSQLDSVSTPRSVDADGNLVKAGVRWWCSGFFPGTLWYIYEYTSDENIKALAEKEMAKIEEIKFRTDDHDVGFQINCSFGNAYRLTGKEEYKEVMHIAANSLSTRFNSMVGCTRSWNNKKYSFPVIIDNMMNLELLVRVAQMYDEPQLLEIALAHANTTIEQHFREDFSTYHLVDYNPETGDVLKKITVQGYEDWSSWSRGQAWALYGYTMMYELTKEPTYLVQAENIAQMLLKRLPKDGVPYWDFDAAELLLGKPYSAKASAVLSEAKQADSLDRAWAGEVNGRILRDASAGAIMASAFVRLSELSSNKDLCKRAIAMAEKQIRELASSEYLATPGENYGFILKHSTGHYHGNSEIDVPLTYADYYFLEAILRYNLLMNKN